MSQEVAWDVPKNGVELLVGAYRCAACGVGSIAVATNDAPGFITTAGNVLDRLSEVDAVAWFPERSVDKDYPDVPTPIADAASEAFACNSAGRCRASVLLARSVIEATAKDKGITTGNLYNKIEALRTAGHIREDVKEAAHEIRFLGNDMAHGDFATTTVEQQEADGIITLMEEILEEVFQGPARVAAIKANRLAKKQP